MKHRALPWLVAATLLLVGCSKETSPSPAGGNSPERTPTAGAGAPLSGNGFAPKLCSVLEKIAPELRRLAPAGAQAQLVMAIDAAALRRVSDEKDTIASAGCPAARTSLLATLEMQSLQAAVR